MPCVALAYRSVCGIFHTALLISAVRSEDPRCQLKGMLNPPEASTSKIRHLVTIGDLMVSAVAVRELSPLRFIDFQPTPLTAAGYSACPRKRTEYLTHQY